MVSEVFDCSLPHWEGGTWFICEALYQIKRGGGGGGAGSTRSGACGFQNALKAVLGVMIPELIYIEGGILWM